MSTMVVKNNGRSFKVNIRGEADESVAFEIFKHREYRAADEVIKNATDPIIDVGAHAGFFSLYARSLNPSVKIFAVEPVKENAAAMRENLKINGVKNVEIIEVAVAERTEKRQVRITEDSHNHALVDASNEKEKGGLRIIQALSLSDFLKKCIMGNVSLIKMDIEGAEYEVFRGIKAEVFQKIHSFILEYHGKAGDPGGLEKVLRENGFGVQIFPSKFDRTMGFIFALNKRT